MHKGNQLSVNIRINENTMTDNLKKLMCFLYSQTMNLFTLLDAYASLRIEDVVFKFVKYCVFSAFDSKSAYHQLNYTNVINPSLYSIQGCLTVLGLYSLTGFQMASPTMFLHSIKDGCNC